MDCLCFVLSKKQWDCPDLTPVCCKAGWYITFPGSRFITREESNYSLVEGVILATAYRLENAKHFILVAEKPIIQAVDHNTIFKVVGDWHLEDLRNPKLQRLKANILNITQALSPNQLRKIYWEQSRWRSTSRVKQENDYSLPVGWKLRR